MAHHNSQQNNNTYGPGHVWNSLTPQLPPQINNQQQQQDIHATNTKNIGVISSQPISLASSVSSTSSIGSTSSQVRTEDKLFDQIEDMIRDYMRDPNRHYIHCRVLQWTLDDDDDLSEKFSAVIVINPPTSKN